MKPNKFFITLNPIYETTIALLPFKEAAVAIFGYNFIDRVISCNKKAKICFDNFL